MGVEETSPDWAIRVEINAKGNIATVTAYQKKLLQPSTSINQEGEEGEDDIHSNNKYYSTKQDTTSAERILHTSSNG